MSPFLRRLTLPALLVLSFAAAGCKQGLDQRCQEDSDCDQGAKLVCVVQPTGTKAMGGVCKTVGTTNPDDGGVPVDLAQGDLGDLVMPSGDMTTPPPSDMTTTPSSDLSTPPAVDMAMTPDLTLPDIALPDLVVLLDLTSKGN